MRLGRGDRRGCDDLDKAGDPVITPNRVDGDILVFLTAGGDVHVMRADRPGIVDTTVNRTLLTRYPTRSFEIVGHLEAETAQGIMTEVEEVSVGGVARDDRAVGRDDDGRIRQIIQHGGKIQSLGQCLQAHV